MAEVQAGGTRHGEHTSRRSRTKKEKEKRDAGQVIRSVPAADVYILYVQGGGLCAG